MRSLTQDNKDNPERTQKSFANGTERQNIIYENAKNVLNLDSLQERRHILCLKFARNGIKTIIWMTFFLKWQNTPNENKGIWKIQSTTCKYRTIKKLKHNSYAENVEPWCKNISECNKNKNISKQMQEK